MDRKPSVKWIVPSAGYFRLDAGLFHLVVREVNSYWSDRPRFSTWSIEAWYVEEPGTMAYMPTLVTIARGEMKEVDVVGAQLAAEDALAKLLTSALEELRRG